ncbi:MAG TPA: amidohydrolase [Gemmatimonadales bacterium]|nr:amidohydrolase [Gemmatimonadales bacterium]
MRAAACLLLLLLVSPAGAVAQSDADVARATERLVPALVAIRQDLHRNPELSNRETRTAGVVERELRRLGLEVRTGVARTGVIGVLRGARPGRTVGVRADMDALPVTEATEVPYRSTATTQYLGRDVGVSHACGHDVHVAVALGVAEVLAGMRRQLSGTVVFVFQPAEEGPPPGEKGGAQLMVEEGVLREYAPEIMLALHTNGSPPDDAGDNERTGTVSWRAGPFMASSTAWRARIVGRQSHGAYPHVGIDAIVTATQVVQALQTIRSRTVDPTEPAVVTVGTLRAGDRNNVVAGEALLSGTVRTFSDSLTTVIRERMTAIFEGVTRAAGATYELDFYQWNPVTANDTALTARFVPVLERVLGKGNVKPMHLAMGAEDFAYFSREVPSFYYDIGVVNPGNVSGGHHTPTFRADDEAIPVGVRTMAALVLDYLRGKGK